MCGIVGIMGSTTLSDKQLSLFAGLLYLDKVRGEHATGVIKINPWQNKVTMHKAAQSANVFLGREDTQEFLEKERGRIYIGHNRYATIGDKTKDDNAHPFQDGHISMVHNGGVDRWTLSGLEGYDDDDVEVDSHMVCKTIAKHGIEEAVKKLSGAFTLVWWDDNEKSLNFIRNDERPLWICTMTDGALVWASEREFIDAFVNRKKNNLTYKDEPRELPTDLLISYKFNQHGVLQNGSKPDGKALKFERVADPKPPVRTTSYYGTGGYAQGATAYDDRANTLMKYSGVECRVGSQITCIVKNIEEAHNNPGKCNVWMEYEKLDVVAYFVDRKLVEGAKWMKGTITNCHEATVIFQGTSWKEPRISLSGHSLMRVVKRPESDERPKGERRLTVVGNVWPLKTQGHSFGDLYEWNDFVCKGCSMCGMVPTSYDVRNKSMTVYETVGFKGTLDGCEFICGKCVEDESKGNKE